MAVVVNEFEVVAEPAPAGQPGDTAVQAPPRPPDVERQVTILHLRALRVRAY